MVLPSLFLSHGSPMLALATADGDPYVRTLRDLGKSLPKPRAICLLSSHWYVRGKYVSVAEKPETIYDFGGFPEALYRVGYPAPGYPEAYQILKESISGIRFDPVVRGIDHGGWTVLRHLYPEADVPVFSISVDASESPEYHFRLGEKLRVLRERGILVIGSGNTVHNLSSVDFSPGKEFYGTDAAKAFDREVWKMIESWDIPKLFSPKNLPFGGYAVPTPDHYLPFLTVLGTAYPNEAPVKIFEGYELGSISRMAVGYFGD